MALSRWRCSNTAGSALCVRVGINLRYFRIRLKSHFAEPAGTTTVAATMIHSFLKTTIHFAKSCSVILAIGLIAAAATSKGMNYSPVPIGAAPEFIPYGDYFIPYYANVWRPDIDKMRAAGINVIKLYAGNPY